MPVIQSMNAHYHRASAWLALWLGPPVLLFMRIWVALAFWHAGIAKLDDPMGTQFLFNTTYQVPVLAPNVAAALATWIELIVPWFVGLGALGRLSALFLFVYNIIAFISFPALWPHGFWTGLFDTADFADHKVWGMMLLVVIAWGPGRFSLDAAFRFAWTRWRGARHVDDGLIQRSR